EYLDDNPKTVIEEALKVVNSKIREDYEPYEEDKDKDAINYDVTYNIKNSNAYTMTGIVLAFDNFCSCYYEDYESTINMGFEWGAGNVISEMDRYIDSFISTVNKNNSIMEIIKLFDINTQFAYWLLAKEIYEIEMDLREVINYVLFKEHKYSSDWLDVIKNKINFKHTINKQNLNENFENEIFSLDFVHYIKLFEQHPKYFPKEIIKYIDNIRIFRNSVMHNKGLTTISPQEYWESKKELQKFISYFYKMNKNKPTSAII
ncbi:MAG: hypothetical protein WCG95_06960, partial [bacterium]